ncbi:MAG: matrixin family metalloprotease, partial [Phycisphaerae bacterium]
MWCTRRLLIAWTVLLLIAPSFGETPTRPPTSNGVSDTPVAVCFAPGTPREVMARVHAAIFPREFNGSRYFTGGSWSGIGEPTIITWSLVPDGLFISGDVGEPGSPSALFARMDSLFGNRSLWINLIQFSLERWAQLTGVQYVRVTAPGVDWDDGAPWGSSGSAARGDVRIAMHNIDGDAGILAYNFFPQNGDMVLDEGESWQDSLESFRFLRNVIMHEHGHGLGLGHVCTGISAQLMNPFLNLSFDGPQHDDIRGGQRQHGDPFEPDNTVTEATDLGVVEHGAPLDVGAVP